VAGSEIHTVELFNLTSLYIIHTCEAVHFSKTDILILDNLIVRPVCRLFNVHSRDDADCLR